MRTQVLLGVGEARAETAHRERRPHDERVPEVERELLGLLERLRDVRAGDLGSGLDHEVLEELAVFALADGIDLRADELDAVLLEDARVVQGDRRVQRGLAAQRRQHRIGPLLDDDRLDDLGRDRLDVRRVGEVGVGHDRGRIGVHEDDPHALGTQHPAGLRARVVELGRLSDDDRTGSDDEDAVDVVALGHQCSLDSLSRRDDHVAEPVEEVVRVVRAGRRFGVVLHAERGDVEAVEALDDVVVEVDVAHLDPPEALARVAHPIDGGVDREAVVVRGDLDAARGPVEHGLVDAPVTEGQLVGAESERAAEQLVAEADSEVGHVVAQHGAQQVDVTIGCLGVAGPVREEQRVGLDGEHVVGGRPSAGARARRSRARRGS